MRANSNFLDRWLASTPLNEYEIGESEVNRRFLVKTWHHPDLRREVDELSSEFELLALIDRVIWSPINSIVWEGTADKLRNRLTSDSRSASDAKRLLKSANATGTILGRLAKKVPERVQPNRTGDARKWRILPPAV